MKGKVKIVLFLLIISLLTFTTGCKKNEKDAVVTLNISAAASLKDSMNEIKQLYETQNSNIKLNFNFGSSGMLQQQIEQGADVDVFISAGVKQMDALDSKTLILKNTRKNILQSDVVLIVPKESSTVKSFNDLTDAKVNKIALGEPKSVPAGQYAEEVLTKLGLLDKVKSKVVYGKDVKEVLAWVQSGDADAGIVYTTDAKTSDKVKIVATAPENSHSPVIYPAAVVSSSKKSDNANDFMNFLTGSKAKAVFEKYGFNVYIK